MKDRISFLTIAAANKMLNRDQAGKWAGLFARNIGDLEEEISSMSPTAEEMQGVLAELEDIVDSVGLSRASRINRPNLLNQRFWTSRDMPTSAVIAEELTVPAEDAAAAAADLTFTVTNEAITGEYVLHFVNISDTAVVPWTSVSCTAGTGSATITITARTDAHNSAVTVKVFLCTVESRNVVYGNAARIAGTSYPYMRSILSGNYPGDDSLDGIVCTVADLKPDGYSSSKEYAVGDRCLKSGRVYRCTTPIATGGEAWNAAHWTEIHPEWVTDGDGEEYPKAIQYDITEQSAWGNAEYLMYYYPYYSRTYPEGAENVKNWGQIEEMTPGKTYTMSCWVRVTSGDGVFLKMGYGNSSTNVPFNDTTGHKSGLSDIIQVDAKGGAWQRVSWTFEFNPTGDWYTETSQTVEGETTVTRSYNWYKKVCFGVCRKYTATVQVCGFRLAEGGLYLPTQYDNVMSLMTALEERVEELEEEISTENTGLASRVAALEAMVTEMGGT